MNFTRNLVEFKKRSVLGFLLEVPPTGMIMNLNGVDVTVSPEQLALCDYILLCTQEERKYKNGLRALSRFKETWPCEYDMLGFELIRQFFLGKKICP